MLSKKPARYLGQRIQSKTLNSPCSIQAVTREIFQNNGDSACQIRPSGTCGDIGDLSPVMLCSNSFTLFRSVYQGTAKSEANNSNHSCQLRMGKVLNWMCQGKIKHYGKSFNIYMRPSKPDYAHIIGLSHLDS